MATKISGLIEAKELKKIAITNQEEQGADLTPFFEKVSEDLRAARAAGKDKLRVKVTSWPINHYRLQILFIEAGYDVETQYIKTDAYITLGWA